MKTGDIIFIKGHSKRAELIRDFQSKRDPEAGQWNHTGILLKTRYGVYVVEAAEVEGRKLKAAIVVTPLWSYVDQVKEWKIKEAAFDYSEFDMEQILLKYVGVPYDYRNLLGDQVIRTLTGWYPGRKDLNAWKRMTCHEFTMKAWDEMRGIFPEYYKGDIETIYHSDYFRNV